MNRIDITPDDGAWTNLKFHFHTVKIKFESDHVSSKWLQELASYGIRPVTFPSLTEVTLGGFMQSANPNKEELDTRIEMEIQYNCLEYPQDKLGDITPDNIAFSHVAGPHYILNAEEITDEDATKEQCHFHVNGFKFKLASMNYGAFSLSKEDLERLSEGKELGSWIS